MTKDSQQPSPLNQRYIEAMNQVFDHVRTTQMGAINEAASKLADVIANGGLVHLYDSGHLVDSELINRAGGLLVFRRFRYNFSVENPVNPSRKVEHVKSEQEEGIGSLVLRQSNIGVNDAVIIGSVSGKTANIIDLALSVKKAGLPLIALTSLEYSSSNISDHSSGKRLFEIADIVIDNCAPKGDALLEVEGVHNKMAPASGLSAGYIMWMLNCTLVDELLARDITPTILASVNGAGGWDNYRAQLQRFDELGY